MRALACSLAILLARHAAADEGAWLPSASVEPPGDPRLLYVVAGAGLAAGAGYALSARAAARAARGATSAVLAQRGDRISGEHVATAQLLIGAAILLALQGAAVHLWSSGR